MSVFFFLHIFASERVSHIVAGEFGMVYRAYLSGWENTSSHIVAVKTLKST